MFVTYQRTFRVRHYECDAYGHLNHVNYIRYMQETALDASAAAGWDMARYAQLGQMWLIRETDIEYLLPLTYNEDVTITTWVADFRRVQSRRMYEFHRGTGELVARASTNWIFVDMAAHQLATIPQAMIAAFMPDGVGAATGTDKFPLAPPQPEGTFRLHKRVEWRDIDTVGHVNNAAYMSYFEDASTQVGRAFGWPMRRMIDAGFAIVLRRFRIQYLQPAVLDDEVEVACWISDVKRVSGIRHYTLTRSGDSELLAKAQGLLVCLDLQSLRPIRIPQHLLSDFAANIAVPLAQENGTN